MINSTQQGEKEIENVIVTKLEDNNDKDNVVENIEMQVNFTTMIPMVKKIGKDDLNL